MAVHPSAGLTPKDYTKWAELLYQWVRYSVDRYGKEEVESWDRELWNEPNMGYWQRTTQEHINCMTTLPTR